MTRRAGPAALGTVLVLDGQTNQALACVRSLGRAGWRVLVASERRFPLAGWSRYCAGRFRLAGETTAAFAALRDWARERDVTAVLPTTERSCQLCDAGRQAWEAVGIRVACAPGEILARAFNKAETLRYADIAGVRTPPTRVPGSLEECVAAGEAVGFPCVVKARFSNYWDGQTFSHTGGTHYVADAASLARVAPALREGGSWPLVQGFVPGTGCAVFALCDHGRAVLWFAHERLRDVRPSGSGSSLRRAIALTPRLRDPAERLLKAMAWHGPAMVEFRDPGDGDPWLMEVNGRFWGSLDLAVVAGADFPRAWLDIVAGRSLAPAAAYRTDVAVRWWWGDVKRFLYILAGKPAGFPGRYPTVREGLRELFGRQPPGTSSETWKSDDRWPALGEWVQGIGELAKQRAHARPAQPTARPAPLSAEGQATTGTR